MVSPTDIRAPNFGAFSDAYEGGLRSNNALLAAAREDEDYRLERKKRNALAEAGRLRATGDDKGAIAALNDAGLVSEAVALEKFNMERVPEDVRTYKILRENYPETFGGNRTTIPQGDTDLPDIPQGDSGGVGIPGVFDKYRSSSDVEFGKTDARERAKAKAAHAEEDRKRMTKSRNLQAGFNQLIDKVSDIDPTTFENALGPIQGSDVDDILDSFTVGGARVLGAIAEQFNLSGNRPTSEVRGLVRSFQKGLSAAVKPLVALKGERFTDKDQQQLDEVVGDLAASGSKEEFGRRVRDTIDRINATWGLDITEPEGVKTLIQGGGPQSRSVFDAVTGYFGGQQPEATVPVEQPTNVNAGASLPPEARAIQELRNDPRIQKAKQILENARARGIPDAQIEPRVLDALRAEGVPEDVIQRLQQGVR
jgi:hypothetical protein